MRTILFSCLLLCCLNIFAYHDPNTGRFLSRDPIGEDGGKNLYAIVNNDTINKWDSLGLWYIDRDSSSRKTEAIAEKGDTIRGLAELIGLGINEYKLWADVGENGVVLLAPNNGLVQYDIEITDPDDQYCCGTIIIPNTYLKYWAGEVGILGRIWTVWHLRGVLSEYHVIELFNDGVKQNDYEQKLVELANNKELYGTLFIGHGSISGFDDKNGLRKATYSSLQLNLNYGPAFADIYACFSESGRNAFEQTNTTGELNLFDDYCTPLLPGGNLDLPFSISPSSW